MEYLHNPLHKVNNSFTYWRGQYSGHYWKGNRSFINSNVIHGLLSRIQRNAFCSYPNSNHSRSRWECADVYMTSMWYQRITMMAALVFTWES